MIFGIIKLIVWMAGVAAIAYFVLPYFGYTVNTDYFHESKDSCQEKLTQCQNNLIKSGLDGAKETCDFQCLDPKILIKKEE
ncbi:MAG: hypothetical protein HYV45_03495 [Candidatus Moranbacteria bacterium]|nr:hypothetical protein [Candidatus Moranbacteria bacterium]